MAKFKGAKILLEQIEKILENLKNKTFSHNNIDGATVNAAKAVLANNPNKDKLKEIAASLKDTGK